MPLDEQRGYAPIDASWSALAANYHDRATFLAGWLAITCNQIGGVKAALLLLGPEEDGAFVPASVWPHSHTDVRYLSPFAERALAERRGFAVPNPEPGSSGEAPGTVIAAPVVVGTTLRGAVVLEIDAAAPSARQTASRLLYWATAWIINRFLHEDMTDARGTLSRFDFVLNITGLALAGPRSAAAIRVANEVASRLGCDKVSIGFLTGEEIKVAAMSNNATFDPRMEPVRLLSAAMDEAVDLGLTITFPLAHEADLGCPAHTTLARELNDAAICSVLLRDGEQTIGVLTCERADGPVFDSATISQVEGVAALLGPIFALHEAGERGVVSVVRQTTRRTLQGIFGPTRPALKMVGVVVLLLMGIGILVHGTYWVTAKAVTEGLIQQAAIAPFDGHIAASYVRAGDVVKKGQPLCRLDDRDLQLQLEREVADRARALSRKQAALARNDRATMEEAQAEVMAADARIALTTDRLHRATVVAPFAGVVVAGDLSQLRGAPVQQGKLLFQIAPLAAYRVVLDVDERDIAAVHDRMRGDLRLEGLPGRNLHFIVSNIMPVTTQADGHNFFRVEATLDQTPKGLRPGMEGVGKIDAGQRHWLWILTHSMTDWLRLWLWRNLP